MGKTNNCDMLKLMACATIWQSRDSLLSVIAHLQARNFQELWCICRFVTGILLAIAGHILIYCLSNPDMVGSV